MENLLNITLQNRRLLHSLLLRTPRESLLKIPDGFSNNIWWNIAHVVVTQQLLVYRRSGLPMLVDTELVEKFKKGTVPDGTASDAEIERLSALLLTTIEKTRTDYRENVFQEYMAYETSTKAQLNNVVDALSFNLYHEGLHLGSILALRKALARESAA
ncbi:DinB family protein [Flavobacteriaceae bacterium 3-367]